MRLGVLDVGSNTVHLAVVDARPGAGPHPVGSHKTELRLAELLHDDGTLGARGTDALVAAVTEAQAAAADEGVDELLAIATSAVREAPDGEAALQLVRARTGVDLQVLSGEGEARLTFLAVRRWFGWRAGRLLCLDIGGGSLELAAGADEAPEAALSLPLGAGRVTRDRLHGDPPPAEAVTAVHDLAEEQVARVRPLLLAGGPPDRAVGTSTTFRTLARVSGADRSHVPRALDLAALEGVLDRLAGATVQQRSRLPGVAASRAAQLLGGALVARAAMTALDLERVELCPWALREGVVLRRLDRLQDVDWLR